MSEDIPGYRAISWEPLDVLSDEVMDRMSANMQALHDFTPRAAWSAGDGAAMPQNVKIISGRKLIPRQGKDEVAVDIGFRNYFSSGCVPNMTTGINARMQQNIYCTFSGNEGKGLLPDQNGCTLHVQIAREAGEKKKIARNIWIHWMAMGY